MPAILVREDINAERDRYCSQCCDLGHLGDRSADRLGEDRRYPGSDRGRLQPVQSLRGGGLQSVQSLRGGGLQSVQSLRGDLQSVQSLRGCLQSVQSLRGCLQSVQSLRGNQLA